MPHGHLCELRIYVCRYLGLGSRCTLFQVLYLGHGENKCTVTTFWSACCVNTVQGLGGREDGTEGLGPLHKTYIVKKFLNASLVTPTYCLDVALHRWNKTQTERWRDRTNISFCYLPYRCDCKPWWDVTLERLDWEWVAEHRHTTYPLGKCVGKTHSKWHLVLSKGATLIGCLVL